MAGQVPHLVSDAKSLLDMARRFDLVDECNCNAS
jgi:hypothetical protein